MVLDMPSLFNVFPESSATGDGLGASNDVKISSQSISGLTPVSFSAAAEVTATQGFSVKYTKTLTLPSPNNILMFVRFVCDIHRSNVPANMCWARVCITDGVKTWQSCSGENLAVLSEAEGRKFTAHCTDEPAYETCNDFYFIGNVGGGQTSLHDLGLSAPHWCMGGSSTYTLTVELGGRDAAETVYMQNVSLTLYYALLPEVGAESFT